MGAARAGVLAAWVHVLAAGLCLPHGLALAPLRPVAALGALVLAAGALAWGILGHRGRGLLLLMLSAALLAPARAPQPQQAPPGEPRPVRLEGRIADWRDGPEGGWGWLVELDWPGRNGLPVPRRLLEPSARARTAS